MGEPTVQPGQNSTRIIVAVAAIVIIAVAAFGLAGRKTPQLGDAAPEFQMTLYGGGELALSQMRGQVVVLNFWATWCEPCRDEMPDLERAWQAYRARGVAFIGVNVRDVEGKGLSFLQETGVTYPNGYDTRDRLWRAYGLTGVPETFFIDKEGRIVDKHLGQISEAKLREVLEAMLD